MDISAFCGLKQGGTIFIYTEQVLFCATCDFNSKLYQIRKIVSHRCAYQENMFSQQSGFSRTAADKLTCITHIYLSKLPVHCAHFPTLFLTLHPFKDDVHSTSCVSPLTAIKD